MIRRALHRFLCDRKGNLSAMFALTLVPVAGLIGMGVDFTLSAKRKAMLDAIADSASLAAVRPALPAPGQDHVRQPDRQIHGAADRPLAVHLVGRSEHRFLSVARQLAFHGDR